MRKISFERSKGFTLVELMVVIAIIGILAVAALGIVRGAQQRAKTAAIKATAANITTALEAYYTTAGVYPDSLAALSADGVNKVLDKTPTVPSGCDEVAVTGGSLDSLETCGIAYNVNNDGDACSVANQCYSIYQKFADGTTDVITGGQ